MLGDRTVFQCWTITALSENSSFPVLEWLCIFCGGAGCRPNNRPHWLTLTFLPPWTIAAVTLVVPGKVAFSAALVNTRCTWFWPVFAGSSSRLATHTQHDLWRLEQMCLLFIFCHTATVQTHRWSHHFSRRDDVSSRCRLRTRIPLKYVPAPRPTQKATVCLCFKTGQMFKLEIKINTDWYCFDRCRHTFKNTHDSHRRHRWFNVTKLCFYSH